MKKRNLKLGVTLVCIGMALSYFPIFVNVVPTPFLFVGVIIALWGTRWL